MARVSSAASAAAIGNGGGTTGSTADSSATGKAAAAATYSSCTGPLPSKRPGGMAHSLDQLDHARKLLGVDNRELDLPGIAVIGGQSAGKTSVLELLSGISLPRCKRFPGPLLYKIPHSMKLEMPPLAATAPARPGCWSAGAAHGHLPAHAGEIYV